MTVPGRAFDVEERVQLKMHTRMDPAIQGVVRDVSMHHYTRLHVVTRPRDRQGRPRIRFTIADVDADDYNHDAEMSAIGSTFDATYDPRHAGPPVVTSFGRPVTGELGDKLVADLESFLPQETPGADPLVRAMRHPGEAVAVGPDDLGPLLGGVGQFLGGTAKLVHRTAGKARLALTLRYEFHDGVLNLRMRARGTLVLDLRHPRILHVHLRLRSKGTGTVQNGPYAGTPYDVALHGFTDVKLDDPPAPRGHPAAP